MKENIRKNDRPAYVSNVHRGFTVQKDVYYRGIMSSIEKSIARSPDRLSKLTRFLFPMKMMGLCTIAFYCRHYRLFTRILLEECQDSELIVEFTEACGIFFLHWLIMDNKNKEIVDYVLYHAQKMKLEMYNPRRELFCPTSKSMFSGKVQNAIPLIKYGRILKPATHVEVRRYIHFSCMFR